MNFLTDEDCELLDNIAIKPIKSHSFKHKVEENKN